MYTPMLPSSTSVMPACLLALESSRLSACWMHGIVPTTDAVLRWAPQEAVLLPKHLAVVSELGQESLASWLSGHRATGTRPHLSAARQLFQQLLTALEFCSAHHMGFVDLRPQSIMLHLSTFEGCEGDADALTLKLAGFVSLLSGHGRYGDISAAGFIAPEVTHAAKFTWLIFHSCLMIDVVGWRPCRHN